MHAEFTIDGRETVISIHVDEWLLVVCRLRLFPGENVVWAARKGIFALSFILAFLGILGGFILAVFGFTGAEVDNRSIAPIPPLGWVGLVLFLVGLVYMIISTVSAKSTKYILTNQRIVETRFGKIVKQISISNFMGKPLSQFLDKEATGTVNKQPVYTIRITDPRTADFMELVSLNQRAVEELERICERARQVVLCTYCKTKNSANSLVCNHCGAPLK